MKFYLILALASIALPAFADSLSGKDVLTIDGITVSAQYSDEGWITEGKLYDSNNKVQNPSFISTKAVYMKYSVQSSQSIDDVIEDTMFAAADKCRGMVDSVKKEVSKSSWKIDISSFIPEASINLKNQNFVSMRCVIEANGYLK